MDDNREQLNESIRLMSDAVLAQEPWPEPVNGAALLSEVEETMHRFVVCTDDTVTAATLWCAFTWFINVVQTAPLAIITAPEKRCGKSQLLDLMARLSRNPLQVSNTTGAALVRMVDQQAPTLFIDEADSFMKRSEDIRGIINSGHTRAQAFSMRVVKGEAVRFSTWGAKAIAGIGQLADTIMDRGIILELRRKLPEENVERLRQVAPDLFPRLVSMLARWSLDHLNVIRSAQPDIPKALNDREQDSWEPLLAIADCAGGKWPWLARSAAVSLSKQNADNTISAGIELLADIRDIFDSMRVNRLPSQDLLKGLTSDLSKSWCRYNHGAPMCPKQLAQMLKGYSIVPGTIRTLLGTPKGYKREQFADAFARYL
jgi:putative DNA primase/helicase